MAQQKNQVPAKQETQAPLTASQLEQIKKRNEELSNELGLPMTIVEGLKPLYQGWLRLANLKETTFEGLKANELQVQEKLNGIEKICLNEKSGTAELETVQTRIAEAVKLANEGKAQRLDFTNLIKERIAAPAMEFEQRNALLIKTANDAEMKLREQVEAQNEAGNAVAKEESAFKTFFVNEYYRIATEFREAMRLYILEQYEAALTKKMPVANLKKKKSDIAAALLAMKPGKLNKFDLKAKNLITAERATELFKEIAPYKAKEDINAAIASVDEVFGMYSADLKKPNKAKEQMREQIEKKNAQEKKQLRQETAAQTLEGKANAARTELASKHKVKKLIKIVPENSEEWVVAIMRHGYENWDAIKGYFPKAKNRDWTKLTLPQVAEALAKLVNDAEEEITFNGLKFQTVKK